MITVTITSINNVAIPKAIAENTELNASNLNIGYSTDFVWIISVG